MHKSDIEFIEDKLKITLPNFYKESMTNYPFKKDSFIDEFLLCNDKDFIIECNEERNENQFFVGQDGGEEAYYILLDGNETVYTYDFEMLPSKSQTNIFATNWSEFINKCKNILEEIEQDELLELERKRNKKWWQFWI